MSNTLFRPEALRQQGERLWGDLILSQPLPYAVFTLFLAAITAVALWFLMQHDYLRKQTVTGILVPDQGLIDIRAPATGGLASVYVVLDQQVAAGTPLFTLQLDHTRDGGEGLTGQLLQEVDLQQHSLQTRKAFEKQHLLALRQQFAERSDLLAGRLQGMAALADSEAQLLGIRQDALLRARGLNDRGLLADADYDAVRAQQLQQHVAVRQIELQQQQVHAELARLKVEASAAVLTSQRELQRIDAELADLARQRLRLGAEQATTVVAPVAGRITSVLRQSGMNVNPQERILVLMPAGSRLEAQLLLPSSAIGFISPRQQVNIRYDAFPYQKFGIQQARVSSVSESAVLTDGEGGTLPLFRVSAALERHSITAYGAEQPLRPGMAFSADIVVDERSLMEWLLEPLFSIRGKL